LRQQLPLLNLILEGELTIFFFAVTALCTPLAHRAGGAILLIKTRNFLNTGNHKGKECGFWEYITRAGHVSFPRGVEEARRLTALLSMSARHFSKTS